MTLRQPDREEIAQSPPSNPHPDGRSPQQFHMDLGDAQLRQLMEDLWQEVAHRELMCPPRNPPSGHWRTPAGDGDPNVDDKEVTFPGGRGGSPEDSHLDPLAPLNQKRM